MLAGLNNGLTKIVLINSFIEAGLVHEFDFTKNSHITGANGIGKTTLLKLLPIFYGMPINTLMKRSDSNESFTSWYLGTPASYIVFEYITPHNKKVQAVFFPTPDGSNYQCRFINKAFEDADYIVEDNGVLSALLTTDITKHWHQQGVDFTATLKRRSHYQQVIQYIENNEIPRDFYKYSIATARTPLIGIDKVIHGILTSKMKLSNMKSLIMQVVGKMNQFDSTIKVTIDKDKLDDWVADLRIITELMKQKKSFDDALENHSGLQLLENSLLNILSQMKACKPLVEAELSIQNDNLQAKIKDKKLAHSFYEETEAEYKDKENDLSYTIENLAKDILNIEDKDNGFREDNIELQMAEYNSLDAYKEAFLQLKSQHKTLIGEAANINADFEALKLALITSKDKQTNLLKDDIATHTLKKETLFSTETDRYNSQKDAEIEQYNASKDSLLETKARTNTDLEVSKSKLDHITPCFKLIERKEETDLNVESNKEEQRLLNNKIKDIREEQITAKETLELNLTLLKKKKYAVNVIDLKRVEVIKRLDILPSNLTIYIEQESPSWETSTMGKLVDSEYTSESSLLELQTSVLNIKQLIKSALNKERVITLLREDADRITQDVKETEQGIELNQQQINLLISEKTELESLLDGESGSLLSFLEQKVESWHTTSIGRLINPDILGRKDLSPMLLDSKSSDFFGLQIDFDKLEPSGKSTDGWKEQLVLVVDKIEETKDHLLLHKQALLAQSTELTTVLQTLKKENELRESIAKERLQATEITLNLVKQIWDTQIENLVEIQIERTQEVEDQEVELTKLNKSSKEIDKRMQSERTALQHLAANQKLLCEIQLNAAMELENDIEVQKNALNKEIKSYGLSLTEISKSVKVLANNNKEQLEHLLSVNFENRADIESNQDAMIDSANDTIKKVTQEKKAELKSLSENQAEALTSKGVSPKKLDTLNIKIEEAEHKKHTALSYEVNVRSYNHFMEKTYITLPDLRGKHAALTEQKTSLILLFTNETRVYSEKREKANGLIDHVEDKIKGLSSIFMNMTVILDKESSRLTNKFSDFAEGKLEESNEILLKYTHVMQEILAKEIVRGRALKSIQYTLNQYGANGVLDFWQKSLLNKGAYVTDDDKMQVFKDIVDHTIPQYRRTLIAQIHSICEPVVTFTGKLKAFSSEISLCSKQISSAVKDNLITFSTIEKIDIQMISKIDRVQGWGDLNRLCRHYEEWDRSDQDFPSLLLVKALQAISEHLEKGRIKEDFVDLFDLSFEVIENGNTKTAQTEHGFENLSSNGVNTLLGCTLYSTLISIQRKGLDMQIHYPVDELSHLSTGNAIALLEMLNKNNITMIAALPEAKGEMLKNFERLYHINKLHGKVDNYMPPDLVEQALLQAERECIADIKETEYV